MEKGGFSRLQTLNLTLNIALIIADLAVIVTVIRHWKERK